MSLKKKAKKPKPLKKKAPPSSSTPKPKREKYGEIIPDTDNNNPLNNYRFKRPEQLRPRAQFKVFESVRPQCYTDRVFQHNCPVKLTPELMDQFSDVLQRCFFMDTAAACVGIGPATWKRWMKRGRAEQARIQKIEDRSTDEYLSPEPIESEKMYLEFYNVYRFSIAQSKLHLLEMIHAAAAKQWQAAAWLLERRFPDEWGSDKAELRDMRNRLLILEEEQRKAMVKV